MSTYNLKEERLSERQQRLARMLLSTLRPGERERILTEKTLVDSGTTAHISNLPTSRAGTC